MLLAGQAVMGREGFLVRVCVVVPAADPGRCRAGCSPADRRLDSLLPCASSRTCLE